MPRERPSRRDRTGPYTTPSCRAISADAAPPWCDDRPEARDDFEAFFGFAGDFGFDGAVGFGEGAAAGWATALASGFAAAFAAAFAAGFATAFAAGFATTLAAGFVDALAAGGAGAFAADFTGAFDTTLVVAFTARAAVILPDTAAPGFAGVAWADEDFFAGFFKETSDLSDAGLEPVVGGRTVRGKPVRCWLDGAELCFVRRHIADRRQRVASNSRQGAA